MNQEYAVQFDRHWSDFQSKLKSRIQMRSQSGALSCPQMNVILKDCALGWDSRGTMWGWWMADLEAQNPDKARIVREILLEDMRFRKIPERKGIHGAVKALVPAAGATAGFAVSRLLEAALSVQLLCAAVLAAVLLPAMLAADRQVHQDNIDAEIQDYLDQLELYHRSIQSVLRQ